MNCYPHRKNFGLCSAFIIILVFFFKTSILAQSIQDENPTPPELRLKWFDEHVRLKQESPFRKLKWRQIGPSLCSGRITDIAVPKGRPYTIYISAASGGVWKTVNNGTTWQSIWDNAASNSVGDIAVAESNPDILWVGAGENNSSRCSYSGTGVYKSTDAGATWTHMGLSDSHHIGRIVIDPLNSDIVYVAALGHLYTRNEERGLYKTMDGGRNWERLIYIDDNTGFIDLIMDPSDNQTLFAVAWERIRKAWNMTYSGPGTGVYKTTDAGTTWKELTNGLPTDEHIGRIGLDISVSNPDVIYALVDDYHDRTGPEGKAMAARYNKDKVRVGAETYRSDDKGETWRKVTEDDLGGLYYLQFNMGYYFGEIRVSPDNEDEIYMLGAPLYRSTDGGKTSESIDYPDLHADHQAFWIDPDNCDHLICGNDGGLNISYDRGKTWVDVKMPLGTLYSVAFDMEMPFNVYGSLQDNMAWYGPVTSVPGPAEEWRTFPSGERSAIAFDTSDYNTFYTTAPHVRIDRKTMTTTDIRPQSKEGEPRFRTNWFSPIIVSPHNPHILYTGTQFIHRSLDRGDHWETISPDLTKSDPERLKGDVPFGTITMISESPKKFGLIYVGTDDGNVQVTKNGGMTWEKIMDGLPNKWVAGIIASKYDEATVYVALTGYRDDDFAAYLFKSADYGNSWENIADNLPGGPINVFREDPKKENILYCGTDLGIYASLDSGAHWISLCSDLPTTFVHDIAIHPRDDVLIIGTHGRSVWVLDVGIIQEFDAEVQAKDLHLFAIKPPQTGDRRGIPINFFIKDKGPVKIEIFDESGKAVKTMGIKGEQGVNVSSWDLTRDGADPQDYRSRFASAGTYTVRITAGEAKATGKVEVQPRRR